MMETLKEEDMQLAKDANRNFLIIPPLLQVHMMLTGKAYYKNIIMIENSLLIN